MLRYVMKDKGLSTTHGFVFLDETDRQLYRADGRNWTLSREYVLANAEGIEQLRLKQKLFSLSPTYTVSRSGSPCATIRKSGAKFRIDLPDQPPIVVERSLGGAAFAFKRGDHTIANVNRKLVSLWENCTVEVETSEDAELILATMVAIFDAK